MATLKPMSMLCYQMRKQLKVKMSEIQC